MWRSTRARAAAAVPGSAPPPKRRLRTAALMLAAVFALIVLLAAAALLVMQTRWFRQQVAKGIVDTVEDATGGRVELRSFRYDWRSLTAEARGFVLHGKEPAGGAPLFRAASVKIQIRILSVLNRDIDLQSLVVDQPAWRLIVNEDGSTNFPEPKVKRPTGEPLLEQLINLRVKHFELNRGTIAINLKEFPLDLGAENLRLATAYEARAARYRALMSAEQLRLAVPGVVRLGGAGALEAAIERDAIHFSRIDYQVDHSVITASGTLRHLAHPALDLATRARLDVREAGRIVGLPQLNNGLLDFEGGLAYGDAGLVLSGRARAEHVRYQEKHFTVPDARAAADLVLTASKITLKRLSVNTLGADFTGEAELDRYRDLRINGRVASLNTAAIGPLLRMSPLAWQGIASGPVHVAAQAAGRASATVDADLDILPGAAGIPVQGHVRARYRSAPEELLITSAAITLPHSQLTVSGTLGDRLALTLDTTAIEDLLPAFTLAPAEKTPQLPFQVLRGGHIHFAGNLSGALSQPALDGKLVAEHVRLEGEGIDRLTSDFQANASNARVKSLLVEQGPLRLNVRGAIGLSEWTQRKSSALELTGQIEGADMARIAKLAGLPEMQGTASATFLLHGTVASPQGKLHAEVRRLAALGQRVDRVSLDLAATADRLEASKIVATQGKSTVELTGSYQHPPGVWLDGALEAAVRSAGFDVADCKACSELATGWSAAAEVNASLKADVRNGLLELRAADGQADLRDVSRGTVKFGTATLKAHTAQGKVQTEFDALLRGSRVTGSFLVGMNNDYAIDGSLKIDQMKLSAARELSPDGPSGAPLPFDAVLKKAAVSFRGPLVHPEKLEADGSIDSLEFDPNVPATARGVMKPEDVVLRNAQPISLSVRNGQLQLARTRFVALDTSLVVGGSVPLLGNQGISANVEGSLNLQVFQLFDPNVVSSGISTLRVNVVGQVDDPAITGTLELKNAAFHLDKFPNGLERANGVIRFDNHRATIQRLTAHSGGGTLSVDGFVSFGQGGPIVYRLEGRATDVRIRYASAVSFTSTASVRFAGTSDSSLLSGTVTVNRASVEASADIGAIFAATTAPVASPSSESDIFRGVQMDLQVLSGPNFQLSTSLSQDVEADVDLRLRGSPALPSVLGRISVHQGQVQVFGNKYSITRGEVAFFNPAKIEPVLDVDLETQVRSITASITITGTPSKLNVNYRSDPPLQPGEIIALLAVGRTPETVSSLANTQMVNNSTAFTSGANTLLGQALSPVSNRLERLFGVTHIKIDPLVQGLDNSTQARLTLEQQVSKDITITYITNLAHTAEQIFRFEWSVSKQYSIVGVRDENGAFGIDLLYRKQFR